MDIHIEITQNPSYRVFDLWLSKEAPDGTLLKVKPVAVEWVPIDTSGASIDFEPAVRIPYRDAEKLFQAFADVLRARGVVAEPEHQLAGKLKAMEYHLEDFRRLVFEKRIRQ